MKFRKHIPIYLRCNKIIDIDFKFRPVGQGAFFSGVFTHRNRKQFSFVYDCGSDSTLSYIENEIANFVNETRNKKVDLLFISHFHRDHINRISYLLNGTGGAKLAILPYLTQDELLLAYTDASIAGDDPDTLAFIRDSTKFLLDRKVEKIIYIHPGDEPNSGGNEEPDKKDSNPESPDFEFVLSNQLRVNRNIVELNTSVSHYFDIGSFSLVGLWEFKLFNKPRNQTILTNFVQEVKILLGNNHFDFNDLADYIENNPRTFKTDFNRIYSRNFGAGQLINDTSIVLYHGAISNIKSLGKRYRRWMYSRCSGTLLTGDIIFNQSCYDEMNRKWNNPKYTMNVGTFQVPHHGAEDYLLSTLISHYPQVKYWVINFGLGNTHKHPHQSIVDMIEINKFGGEIFENTQVSVFYYGCLYH